jgi:hypothetical protein
MDLEALRRQAAAWSNVFERATAIQRLYGSDPRANPELRQAAGELIRLMRECGPSVRGVVLEGRLFVDCTDPLEESAADSEGSVPWFVSRITLTRPTYRIVEPWQIISADPVPLVPPDPNRARTLEPPVPDVVRSLNRQRY